MKTKADCFALLQEVVTSRDRFCRAPGCSRPSTAAHHIFGRSNLSTAFDPRFAIGMCVGCHVPWAHGHPGEFQEWVISWMGEELYFEALRLSNTAVKHINYDNIYRTLKGESTIQKLSKFY